MCFIFLINSEHCNLPNRVNFARFQLIFKFVQKLEDSAEIWIYSKLENGLKSHWAQTSTGPARTGPKWPMAMPAYDCMVAHNDCNVWWPGVLATLTQQRCSTDCAGGTGQRKGRSSGGSLGVARGFERRTERTQRPHRWDGAAGATATAQWFQVRRRLPDSCDTATGGLPNREGGGVRSHQWKMRALRRSAEELGGSSEQLRCRSGGGFIPHVCGNRAALPRSANGSTAPGDTAADWWARASVFFEI
jgi:hypothetical protein